MTPAQFSDALVRLTKHEIGMHEAAVLFLIATGCDTNRRIVAETKIQLSRIHSRTNALKNKGIIESSHAPNGNMRHVLTNKGAKIIHHVLQ